MIRPILRYDVKSRNNPKVLTEKTRRVTDFDAPETLECVRDLNDTLDDLIRTEGNRRGAIGLSAPQIGSDLAVSAVQLGDVRYVFINPVLAEERGKQRLFRIGCFSLYEYRAMVRYNDDVTVRYFDPSGSERTVDLTGDRACVVQHEMDHLEGMLLFERAEMSGNRLFVPREARHRDGKVPLANFGPFAELRRKLGVCDVQSVPEYYSSIFNDYSDLAAYAAKEAALQEDLLKKIESTVRPGSSLLEVGCGIGALSAALADKGYNVSCAQTDEDMADMAARVIAACGGKADVFHSPLEKLSGRYDAVFSTGLLETLDSAGFTKALRQLASVGERVFISLPTVWEISNSLRGCEHLRMVSGWKKQISLSGCTIEDTYVAGHGETAVFTIRA